MRASLRSILVLGAMASAPLALALWAGLPALSAPSASKLIVQTGSTNAIKPVSADGTAGYYSFHRLGRSHESLEEEWLEHSLRVVPPTAGAPATPNAQPQFQRQNSRVMKLLNRPLPSAIGSQIRLRSLPAA